MWLLREITVPHLAHHALRTTLTAIGIAVGVAAIVATASVTDAVFRSFRRTIEATGGRAEFVISNGNGGVPERLLDEVHGLPDVASATPLVEGFVQLADADDQMLAIFGWKKQPFTAQGRRPALLGSGRHGDRRPGRGRKSASSSSIAR